MPVVVDDVNQPEKVEDAMSALGKIVSRGEWLIARQANGFSLCRFALAMAAAVMAAMTPAVWSSDAAAQADPFPGPLTEIPAEQQIELALGAAPPEISRQATILVLGPKGYVTARTGTNGFTCLVERQYLETLEPSCYDAEGSATTVQVRKYLEELRAAKLPEAEIESRINEKYKAGIFKAPGKPGLVYMLSPHNRVLNDRTGKIIHAPPHLMFYAPYATQKDLGDFAGRQFPYMVLEGRADAYIIVNPGLMAGALQRPPGGAEPDAVKHLHGK